MCYVAAIPWVLAGISAAGAYQQSASQKAQASYQAKVARNNEAIAETQAVDAKERGDRAAQDLRRKYAGLEGEQRAQLAARGLDITDGSANAILQDTAFFRSLDESQARANAAREAWGYRMRAQGFAGEAGMYQAASDAENPLLSSGLAFGTVAAKWYGKPGGWGPGSR